MIKIYIFFDGFAGANRKYQYGFRVINEKASQKFYLLETYLFRPKKGTIKRF